MSQSFQMHSYMELGDCVGLITLDTIRLAGTFVRSMEVCTAERSMNGLGNGRVLAAQMAIRKRFHPHSP